ncbi:hypothetical protein, partial [Mesorhizobium sp.]|uniref:hypothetical protein n=1 Tax=Mesorhizobium sp. TaxID=1871066 RepID=UPI0025F139C9
EVESGLVEVRPGRFLVLAVHAGLLELLLRSLLEQFQEKCETVFRRELHQNRGDDQKLQHAARTVRDAK